MRLSSVLSLASAVLVCVSCYDRDIEGPEPPSAFSITTSVPTLTLRQDDITNFTVSVRDESRGQEVSPIGAFAESDDVDVARVATTSTPGRFRVTAVGGGTARIVVGYTGNRLATDTIVVNVTARPVETVILTPDSTSAFVGVETTFRAVLLDAAGDTITAREATFSVHEEDEDIASIDESTGEATGEEAGTARIIATAEDVADTSRFVVTLRPVNSVTVSPEEVTLSVGDTVTLEATLLAANNSVLTGRTVTWASSDTTIARVNGSGLVTAVGASNEFATITATSEGKSGSARVIVVP